MRSTAEQKRMRLSTQIALALTFGMGTLPTVAFAAITSPPPTYTSGNTIVTDDVDIENGTIKVDSVNQDTPAQHANPTVTLEGNVKILNSSGNILEVLSHGDGTMDWAGVLTINQSETKRVQLHGNILVNRTDNPSLIGGYVNLYLKGEDSYFAGGITDVSGTQLHERGGVRLKLSKGATWYPKGDSYTLFNPDPYSQDFGYVNGTWSEDQNKPRGLHLSANGGVIDMAFVAPNEKRPNTAPAGERTLAFNNTRTALNGATFRISTNLTDNKADKVVLNGVTGAGNQYKLQVAFDPKMNDAVDKTNYVIAPTVADGVEVLNSSEGSDTVTAPAYKTRKAVAAGLLLKDFNVKPTLSESTDGAGRKIVRVTNIEVSDTNPAPQPPPTPPPTPPTPTPTPDPKQQVLDNRKSVVETMAGAVAFLGAGADLAAGGGMASASVEAAAAEGFAPFAAIGGSSMRHETGSHVNMKGLNLAVGFSREVKRGDDRLIFGPIVEYGRGTYDSYVNDAHGDGSVRYVGIGGFVRQEQKDGMFYEGSLRFGRSSMDYSAILSGTPTTYDTDANYIGAHLGVGQRIQEKSGTNRELYLRYFYTRQNGTDTKLSTGERYDFDAVDSHRLRAGARWLIPQKGGSLILGASLQYEFGGESRATVHVGGNSYTTPAPSLNGFSTSLELGWKTQMSKNATADLSIEGWFGKQRGVSFRAGFDWKF